MRNRSSIVNYFSPVTRGASHVLFRLPRIVPSLLVIIHVSVSGNILWLHRHGAKINDVMEYLKYDPVPRAWTHMFKQVSCLICLQRLILAAKLHVQRYLDYFYLIQLSNQFAPYFRIKIIRG